jgi:glycerol-3-phosphate acyltransferase PlsX
MKIAVDAMGGDYAPEEVIKGAVAGARKYGVGVILVGPQERIQNELDKYDTKGLDIEIVHTDEYLVEGEPPAYAMRQKRKASIMVAVKLVRDGKAAAAVGVGPTGGVFAAALQALGTLEGLARPVIGGNFLGFTPQTFVIDLGGNVDSRPDQLLDFGIIGSVYVRTWLKIPNPTVALLSNGLEEGKGNEVTKATFTLFRQSGLNFIGNIEGNDIAAGTANVVICDGFVGNCVVKFCEGLGRVTVSWLRERLSGKLTEEEVQGLVEDYLRKTVAADTIGGGLLLGLNGVVCKGHGRSKAPEVARTIGTAKQAVELDLVGTLRKELVSVRSKMNIGIPNADTKEE